jgi:hypothetical protein
MFCSGPALDLISGSKSSTLGSPSKNVFDSWGETNFGPNGFAYFARNYMTLCVRIGKIDRLRPSRFN